MSDTYEVRRGLVGSVRCALSASLARLMGGAATSRQNSPSSQLGSLRYRTKPVENAKFQADIAALRWLPVRSRFTPHRHHSAPSRRHRRPGALSHCERRRRPPRRELVRERRTRLCCPDVNRVRRRPRGIGIFPGGDRGWFRVVRDRDAAAVSIRCRLWRFCGWSSLFRRVCCRFRRPG